MATVSVFMDVEDPTNLAADDAALDLANLFTVAEVRGSFCITGEKCRKLLERKRQDVIDALRPHCLGLHTDTHSYHPTTMELLADVSYEDGCRLAYETEQKGYEAFAQAFDRPPVYWGGAGNTWSPEICDAIRKLEMRAFVYAQTELRNQPVLRFNDCLGFPQHLSVSETDWAEGLEGGERVADRLAKTDLPWTGVFVGHPTRFRHQDFWDFGFFDGQTPPRPIPTLPVPVDVYERERTNLKAFLIELKKNHTILGLDEAVRLPWSFRQLTDDEQADFRERTARNLRAAIKWPINRVDLDPTNIVEKTLALADTVSVGVVPYG